MPHSSTPNGRPPRADAQRSTQRILEAAQSVLLDDPSASLEHIARVAGLARTTVHRRFATRQALLEALVQQLTDRYIAIIDEVRVRTAPPLVALRRATQITLALKTSHPFVSNLSPTHDSPGAPGSHPQIIEGLEVIFERLYSAGEIGVSDSSWSRRVYQALLQETSRLPVSASVLGLAEDGDERDELDARVELLISTLLGALGAKSSPA